MAHQRLVQPAVAVGVSSGLGVAGLQAAKRLLVKRWLSPTVEFYYASVLRGKFQIRFFCFQKINSVEFLLVMTYCI